MTFDYYDDLDGAIFRRPHGGYTAVRDILTGHRWKLYRGDGLKPVIFGSRISADHLPPDAQP